MKDVAMLFLVIVYRVSMGAIAVICAMNGLWFMAACFILLAAMATYSTKSNQDMGQRKNNGKV